MCVANTVTYVVDQEAYYYCQECFKAYKQQRSLWRHMKYECGKEPQFACKFSKCHYKTKHKASVKNHLMNLHNVTPSECINYIKNNY